jgi:C4-dicarboxylate-specific signal transduction histidine kinase
MKSHIRVLSVDDLPVIREGIVAVTNGRPDMQVEAQASNGHEAVECFVRHRRDITLMNLTVAELSASVVHQVNEPLTSMLANAQAAKRWLAAEPPNLMKAIASIDRIARDARAAGRTIGQIQALVKQASLDKREASIANLISEAVRLVLEDPNMCEVPIQWHCDENLPRVCVDPLAIQEVFIRLISGAIEALENNRSPPVVKVHATLDDLNSTLG